MRRYRDVQRERGSTSGTRSGSGPSPRPRPPREIVSAPVVALDLPRVVESTVRSQRDRALATSTLLGLTNQLPHEEDRDPTSWWRRLPEARVRPLSIPWRPE